MSKKEANEFLDSLKLNESPTNEEFYQAILSAYMDRTRQVYFIWKKIKELYPDIDANKIIREGSWDFGLYQGQKILEKYGYENIGPKEAIMGQTSKGGVMVFDQEILEFTDEKAVKMFNQCPHVKALTELGLSKEEIKMFCRDMLGQCDYAICHPFSNVEIEFPTTVADGEGNGCAMTITRVKK
ncbi:MULTISPECIES: hypothetical protein [unclassified Romboutsia]|uniref:hypothetical protein n=1 Tax=unclassified Romboutsia TaxID=2626894 RepID=UPI000822DE1E|nr:MULTISPECIES: hypothetical protein [unclassified Romboutsia]SCH47399.1 Uncharacterised protein [uncultured Clostridium sp.]